MDKPPSKGRGRGTPIRVNGKFISKVTTPKNTKVATNIVSNAVLNEFTDMDSKGIYKLRVLALFKRPKRLIGVRDDENLLVGMSGSHYPDWDNIGKLVSDAFNKIVWKDDGQVADAGSRRVFVKKKPNGKWQRPGIRVRVWKIGEII